jgi:hypothetical protein
MTRRAAAAAMTSAERDQARARQRRRRERLRAGKRRIVLELDEVTLELALIRRGFLARADADDPAKVAAALCTAVEQWIAPPPDPDQPSRVTTKFLICDSVLA